MSYCFPAQTLSYRSYSGLSYYFGNQLSYHFGHDQSYATRAGPLAQLVLVVVLDIICLTIL